MAIYGIDACHDGHDSTGKFLERNIACIGWSEEEAPALHDILRGVKVGDILYIKSFDPASGLKIKGVGLVVDDTPQDFGGELGSGIRVKWICSPDHELGKVRDKYSPYGNAIYEEMNPRVRRLVAILLIKELA